MLCLATFAHEPKKYLKNITLRLSLLRFSNIYHIPASDFGLKKEFSNQKAQSGRVKHSDCNFLKTSKIKILVHFHEC